MMYCNSQVTIIHMQTNNTTYSTIHLQNHYIDNLLCGNVTMYILVDAMKYLLIYYLCTYTYDLRLSEVVTYVAIVIMC